jgi:hypothetical protein
MSGRTVTDFVHCLLLGPVELAVWIDGVFLKEKSTGMESR